MPLHPDYPVVSGDYQLTGDWSLLLPESFNRRIEDGQLVLWRPQLTFRIIAWGNDHNTSAESRLVSIMDAASLQRAHEQVERGDGLIRLTYELTEHDDMRARPHYNSISACVISADGHLQISAYFDSADARDLAYRVIHSANAVSPS